MKCIPEKHIDGEIIQCDPSEATHLLLKFPLPEPLTYRVIPIITSGPRRRTPCWTWNGDVNKPTLKPSILTDLEYGDGRHIRCHSFVNGGEIKFLSDCTHENANKTCPLVEMDSLEDAFN